MNFVKLRKFANVKLSIICKGKFGNFEDFKLRVALNCLKFEILDCKFWIKLFIVFFKI